MIKKIILGLILILFPLLATPVLAQDSSPSGTPDHGILQNVDRKERVIVSKDEVINKDYFGAGELITISGTVNGDVYLAGGNVIVEGTINGDLLVAGGMVNIRGKVANDVRVAGGEVDVSGEVGGNVSIFGGSVNIADSAKINGSLVAGAGNLSVFAPIGKGATLGVGSLTLGSSINGDLTAGFGEAVLTSSASIAGNLMYWSEKDVRMQQGATVSGQISKNAPPKIGIDEGALAKAFATATLFMTLMLLASYFILGALALRFLPVYVGNVVNVAERRLWVSIGIGFLALVLTPIIILLLFITLIGIPLALILLVLYLIEIFIAKIYIALLVGRKVLDRSVKGANDYFALIVGLVIYALLTLIPIIGGLVMFIVLIWGLGAVMLGKLETYKNIRSRDFV